MHKREKTYLITLTVIIAGFSLLTLFVYLFPDSALDLKFSEEVQEHQNAFMDALMKGVSSIGYMPYSALIVIAVATVFFLFHYKKEGLFILLTMISGLVSSSLKILVNRPRPSQNLVKIIEKAQNQSFPSGHVLFYVTFLGMLVLIMRHKKNLSKFIRFPVTFCCLFLIFTVPLSRIYLGAHWFTDVTAGFIAGMFCLAVLGYFYLFDKAPVSNK